MKNTIERKVRYNGIEFTADNYGNLKINGQLQKQCVLSGYKYWSNKDCLIPVHRIIAKAFCDNPMNYDEVDHINNIKTDNRASNLRWTSRLQNNRRLHKRRANSKNFKCTSHKGEVLKVDTGNVVAFSPSSEPAPLWQCTINPLVSIISSSYLHNLG